MKKIIENFPINALRFKNGGKPPKVSLKSWKYCFKERDCVDVKYWCIWPNYDFVFGIPDENNPYRKKEVALFQLRDTRKKKIIKGFYIDYNELQRLTEGFSKVFKIVKRRLKKK